MNIIKLNAIRPVLNRIRTGQAPVKNYFDSEKGRALAESIQKNVEYFEKDIRSQGKWISLLFDTEKINRLDPEETFRFFAFTTLFQGGDIGTIGNIQKSSMSILYPRNIAAGIAKTSCVALESYFKFKECDYTKSKSKSPSSASCSNTDRPNCPVKEIGSIIHHMKSSAFAKGVISAYLIMQERWCGDMNNIYRQTLSMNDESDAARHLISEISWTMNVNEKISNMFCGWMSNPDIIPSINAWRVGIDWTQFVTIDTMVPRVLKRMGLVPDNASYQNCVYAIRSIARHVDLKRFGFHKYNPMIVEVSIWMLSRKSDGTMQKNSGFCFKEKPDCRGCTVSKSCKKSI